MPEPLSRGRVRGAGPAEPRRAAGPAVTPGCCCPASGSCLSGLQTEPCSVAGAGGVPCPPRPHGRGQHPPPACASSELQRVVCLFNTRLSLAFTSCSRPYNSLLNEWSHLTPFIKTNSLTPGVFKHSCTTSPSPLQRGAGSRLFDALLPPAPAFMVRGICVFQRCVQTGGKNQPAN